MIDVLIIWILCVYTFRFTGRPYFTYKGITYWKIYIYPPQKFDNKD